ncbi:hypothetical protein B0O99DRAFT_737567 [Bisporella sp. PMI_857]|nr:hypothetical protein B0O99DRAFT_737567 [Bisporella sp. PMI_857]
MRFSLLTLAPLLALTAAIAVPNSEASISKRAITKAWEVSPKEFKTLPAVTALKEKPALAKDLSKREADANALALEERQAPFNWILTYVLPYTSSGNTYYYLPYVYNTCFSFYGSNLDNTLSAVNILNTAVYCYFFVDYSCTYSNGYTYFTYANTPQNANSFQDNAWSSYICYGV